MNSENSKIKKKKEKVEENKVTEKVVVVENVKKDIKKKVVKKTSEEKKVTKNNKKDIKKEDKDTIKNKNGEEGNSKIINLLRVIDKKNTNKIKQFNDKYLDDSVEKNVLKNTDKIKSVDSKSTKTKKSIEEGIFKKNNNEEFKVIKKNNIDIKGGDKVIINNKQKSTIVKNKKEINKKKNVRQFHASGKRKTASAGVFLQEGTGFFTVNKKDIKVYFSNSKLIDKALEPLTLTSCYNSFDIKINVKGGGTNAQAEAIRLGIAKILSEMNQEYKSILNKKGLLTVDSRVVEPKKFGHPKSRKSYQFTKR